jgi:hypothetical protein
VLASVGRGAALVRQMQPTARRIARRRRLRAPRRGGLPDDPARPRRRSRALVIVRPRGGGYAVLRAASGDEALGGGASWVKFI